jgi:hypothetical protein
MFFNFEVIRESLAVAISLLAYDSLIRKKWISYYLIAIVCFLAHSSAIMIFILPFLMYVSRANIGKLLLISMLVFFIMGRYINEMILANLNLLMVNERIAGKLMVYLGREEVVFSTGFFLKNVFFPSLVFLGNNLLGNQTRFSVFTKIFLLLGCISMFIPVADRLLNYLVVYYIINMTEVIFMIVERLKGVSFKLLVTASIVMFFAIAPVSWFFTVDTRISEYNYHRYYPYSTYFFKEINLTREKFYRNDS